MAWTTPKSWAAGPWQYTDANTYVRDNFKSARNFAVTTQFFNDGPYTVTTSAANFGTRLNLAAALPDEAFVLIVTMSVVVENNTVGNTLGLTLRDHTGTGIATRVHFGPESSRGTLCCVGGGLYPANTNPGYQVNANMTAGTCTIQINAKVEIVPTYL